MTHIRCDSHDGDTLKDGLPGSDILGLLRHDAAKLRGDFPGVDPDLKQVVDQSQDRSQREGRHEQGHEAKLDDWERKRYTWQNCWLPRICILIITFN